MKRFMFLRAACLCLLVVSLNACQKEISESSLTEDEIASASGHDQSASCKLTSNLLEFDNGAFTQLDEFTYKNGRLDEWIVSYGGSFQIQYYQNGRMKRSVYKFEGDDIYYIDFVYENNRIVKEIWTDPVTGDLADEVTNSYNQRGQIVSSSSVAFDYVVLYDWDQKGNVTRWRVFFSGQVAEQGEYTYTSDARSPFSTINGLTYLFGYANGALFTSKNMYDSEKITQFDENGVPSVIWDLDRQQTQFYFRAGRLPATGNYVDKLSAAPYVIQFAYEACGDNRDKHNARSNPGKNRAGQLGKQAKPRGY
jgi:hypothetical protein